MKVGIKIARKAFFTLQMVTIFSVVNFLAAQDFYSPVVAYSFGEDLLTDKTGNTEMLLSNNAGIFIDSQRGKVLRFNSEDKSYARLNKQMLKTDSATVCFFFYWEKQGATSWHQIFEIHNEETHSNIFYTPQNGWGKNESSVISDNKEYSSYQSVNSSPIIKEKWIHITIVFKGKEVLIYHDGELVNRAYLMFTPASMKNDSLYFGGNPNRSDNFYITARLDEIKVFDKALTDNQVSAIYQGVDIPEPVNSTTNWESSGNLLQLTIDLNDEKQTIQNFGSSDGWNTQRIGKYWPLEKKEKLAELLFNSEKDEQGNPKGIGLSAWRFNIGAGTAEQGEASRISSERRRTEGFLNNDGSYNWDKQIGQQWFLKKAALDYRINHIIGWQNSPPVQYTKNNLGFRDYGTPMETILKQEHFDDFAQFLADVTEHFYSIGIHFDYISPLNEPQYNWSPSESGGTVSQEGTPWTNQEIHDVVVAIDNEFSSRNIDTKLFITEAGSIHYHTSGTGHASNQLYKFWNPYSSLSLVGKSSFANIVSYHSYWKDSGTELIDQRQDFHEKLQTLDMVPEAWQTEYSLLGAGYREGYPDDYKLTEMECALALSKVIITDLNVTNTTGWQWWSTFGLGKHSGEARFCLIEALTKDDNSDGVYHSNKLFYSMGNFSHFIRPGMRRLGTSRSDNLTAFEETSDIMFTAYTNGEEDRLVVVAVNLTNQTREVTLSLKNGLGKSFKNQALYLTDNYTNLMKQEIDLPDGKIIIPAHSVVTYTANLDIETSSKDELDRSEFKAWYRPGNARIMVSFKNNHDFKTLKLYSISGNLLQTINAELGQKMLVFPASHLSEGIYLVLGEGSNFRKTKKVIVKKH